MKTLTHKIAMTTCLWFNKNAEEAATFYAATFPNSRVDAVHKSPSDYPNAARKASAAGARTSSD